MQKTKDNKPSEQATRAGGVSYPFPTPPAFVRTVLPGIAVRKNYPFLNQQVLSLILHSFLWHTTQTKKIVSYVHKSSIDVVAALPVNSN